MLEPDGVNLEKRETVNDLGVGHTSSFLSSVVGRAVEMADRARTRSEEVSIVVILWCCD